MPLIILLIVEQTCNKNMQDLPVSKQEHWGTAPLVNLKLLKHDFIIDISNEDSSFES